jgi:hypothetical protein
MYKTYLTREITLHAAQTVNNLCEDDDNNNNNNNNKQQLHGTTPSGPG